VEPNEADDERYPAAPMPAHERPWRHPSEVGHAAWVRSEPPLAIGRGLTIATGTIGCLLALALLWAVLPTRAGGSTIAAGSTEALPPIDLTVPPRTIVPTTDAPVVDHLERDALLQIVEGTSADPNPIAVVIGDGSLAITTARAVVEGAGRDEGVSIAVPSGLSTRARVLLIDSAHGIAVLESDLGGAALPVAHMVRRGDVLTAVGDRQVSTVVGANGSIPVGYPVSTMREGTPLVNQHGELVALVTRRGGVVRVVELVGLTIFDELVATRDTVAADFTLPAP
jgi:hypothetical protein